MAALQLLSRLAGTARLRPQHCAAMRRLPSGSALGREGCAARCPLQESQRRRLASVAPVRARRWLDPYSHGWISATGRGAALLMVTAAILRLSTSRPAVISLTESAGECEPRASEETGMIPRSAGLVPPPPWAAALTAGAASLRLLATDAGLPLEPLEWSCFTSWRAMHRGFRACLKHFPGWLAQVAPAALYSSVPSVYIIGPAVMT